MKQCVLPIPPLPEQHRIADVLAALDDKIELNRKMNRTLEEMAQAIFKSWFIDFDGHTDLVDSELGPIPRGWRVSEIEDIAEQVAMGPFGSNIKVSTFVESGIPIISGQHLKGVLLEDNTYRFITAEHADRLMRSNVFPGDIVFTHAGTLGQVALIPPEARYRRYVISQRQFYLRCDSSKIDPEYVLHFFKDRDGQHRLLANTNSTGVPSISRPSSNLKAIQLVVPPRQESKRFADLVQSLHSRTMLAVRENETLAELRDTLLPKLISGEIRLPPAAEATDEHQL